MHAPTWLDAHFVQEVLQKSEKDESIEVSSITVNPGVPGGVNYAADIYRVNFEISRIRNGQKYTETSSFVTKAASDDNAWKKMLLESGIFETEISMFTETFPTMNQMLAELGMTALSPRFLHMQNKNPIHLTMEDLTVRGFQMAPDLGNGLDFDHCLIAIQNLAVFHATSIAIVEKDPMAPLTRHTNGIYHKVQSATFVDYVTGSVKALGEEVAKWSELSPRISEKILKLSEVICKKSCEATIFRENDFNVLNHGDFSLINIMFRYDEQQKPVDVKFVDFQFSHYGSPVLDIHFFFALSMSDEVRLNHCDLLLREYHDSLTNTMDKLKCSTKAPSFENFQKIIDERAFCDVVSLLTLLAVARTGRRFTESTVPDEKTGGPPRITSGSEPYRKLMAKILPLYDSKGLLDV